MSTGHESRSYIKYEGCEGSLGSKEGDKRVFWKMKNGLEEMLHSLILDRDRDGHRDRD